MRFCSARGGSTITVLAISRITQLLLPTPFVFSISCIWTSGEFGSNFKNLLFISLMKSKEKEHADWSGLRLDFFGSASRFPVHSLTQQKMFLMEYLSCFAAVWYFYLLKPALRFAAHRHSIILLFLIPIIWALLKYFSRRYYIPYQKVYGYA